MARWVAAGFTVFCVMAMGVVGHAGQAKPAVAQATPAVDAAAKALKNPVPANAVSIETGKGVFDKYCRAVTARRARATAPARQRAWYQETSQMPRGFTDRPTARFFP